MLFLYTRMCAHARVVHKMKNQKNTKLKMENPGGKKTQVK